MSPTDSCPPPPRFWADLKSPDFAQLDKARCIAILPLAAIEQHGPHLPLNVDTALLDGIIAATLPQLPADLPTLFLPTQSIGLSPEHSRFAGTLTLKAETLIRLWTEIAECVARSGVRKLLLLNAHGGNVGLLDVVARDLRARLGLLVYSSSWFQWTLRGADQQPLDDLFSAHEQRFGIHAGELETSLMLALHPEQVAMQQAQNFASSAQTRAATLPLLGDGRSAKLAWQMQDYNPLGAVGNAAQATAEKGRLVLAASARQLLQLLVEVDQLPADTLRE